MTTGYPINIVAAVNALKDPGDVVIQPEKKQLLKGERLWWGYFMCPKGCTNANVFGLDQYQGLNFVSCEQCECRYYMSGDRFIEFSR